MASKDNKNKIKKSRSLTKSEMTLITIFIILGGLYLSDKYVFASKKEEISTVQEKLDIRTQYYNALLADYNKMDELKLKLEDLKNRLLGLKVKIKSFISQEDIILSLDGIAKDSKLSLKNMSLSNLETMTFKEFSEKMFNFGTKDENKQQSNSQNQNNENKVPSTTPEGTPLEEEDLIFMKTVQLDFEGSVQNVYDFLQRIENKLDKIIVTDITLTELTKNNTKMLSGSISLGYLGYAMPDDKDKYKLEVPASESKPNLFHEGGWSNDNINKDTNYSNFMLTLPANKDEGVTFGETYNEASKLYAASRGTTIDAKFKIQKKDDKYTYYYGLDKVNTTLENELVLKDDKIILLVKSHKANENLTKINLSIENLTDKKLEVKIIDDDSTNPLINVKERKGDITVK